MSSSAFAYFRNTPCKSRFVHTGTFAIFTTDFRPRMQSHSLHYRSDAMALYPSGNPDTYSWSDSGRCEPIRGLKQNP
jgi:hypothetical protein